MGHINRTIALWAFIFLFSQITMAFQDTTMVVTAASEAAEGLDLHAVGELFRTSEDLEAFEKALNDPETGINNLDLDDNGEVDYIRVVDQTTGDTHVIILQVQLSKTEFQDVATLDIDKNDDEYTMQVQGNEDIYGPDYYISPTVVTIHTWPIIAWVYRPVYRPYVSPFYFGYYPRWWRPYRPVGITVYHSRTVRIRNTAHFRVTRVNRVTTARKVYRTPRSTTLVKKTTFKTRKGTVTRTKVKQRPAKRTRPKRRP